MKKSIAIFIFMGLLPCLHGMKQNIIKEKTVSTVNDLSPELLKKVEGCYWAATEEAILTVRPPVKGVYQLPAITAGLGYKPKPLALDKERLDDFCEFIKEVSKHKIPFALWCDGFKNLVKADLDKILSSAKNGQMKELYLRECGQLLVGVKINMIPKSVVTLKIANNYQVDDNFVIAITHYLTDLEELSLWNTLITDASFERGISSCKNLKKVTIGLICNEKLSGEVSKFLPDGLTLELIGHSGTAETILKNIDIDKMESEKGIKIITKKYGY